MSIGTPDDLSALTSPCRTGNAGILVVDPDPAFALGLKTFLREYVGFDRVLTARDGDEALDLLGREPEIEVLTLAGEMPGRNGLEVLEALSRRELDRPLAVLMITGHPSEGLEERFRSYASPSLLTRHFLAKPVEFEKLEPVVLRAHEEVQVAKENRLREILAKREEAERASAATAAASVVASDASGDGGPFMDGVLDGGAGPESAGEAEPFSGEPVEWERLIRMEADLARHETKLDRIYGEVRKVKRSVRRAYWSLLIGALLVWAALHYGWAERLEPVAERAKAWSVETWERYADKLPALPGMGGGEKAAAEDVPEAEEVPTEAEAEEPGPPVTSPREGLPEAGAGEPGPSAPAPREGLPL